MTTRNANDRAGLLGFGASLPLKLRGNDDPIYDWIKKNDPTHGQLFNGFVDRHVLVDGETIETHMAAAAGTALAAAGLKAADVDCLLGYTSVSEFITPNSLAQVHYALGLPAQCWPIPVQGDFSNYSASLLLADSLIAAGRANNVLVVCGGNWTRYVNYHTPQCVAAADGAGACVLGVTRDVARFRVVDFECDHLTSGYGNMQMSGDRLAYANPDPTKGDPSDPSTFSHAYYHITPAGFGEYSKYGAEVPPQVVARLLARNGLAPSSVSVVPYQASARLLDAWASAIQPREMLHTLTQNGNMVIANTAVNFATYWNQVKSDYVVLIEMGPAPHATALLLRRNG